MTKFLEIIFRPNEEMSDSQIRKVGIKVAIISLIIFVALFISFVFVMVSSTTGYKILFPIVIFVIAIFYGLGIHRTLWGNTYKNPLYVSWGKGTISLVITLATIIMLSFVGGLVAGIVKGINR